MCYNTIAMRVSIRHTSLRRGLARTVSGISQRSPAALTAFGEDVLTLCTSHLAPSTFYTGKPEVPGLGHTFLFRNYRASLAKWQTADPLGYPDGWNALSYSMNVVSVCVDVTGGWCEDVHHDINETYLTRESISLHACQWGEFSLDVLENMNSGSDWTDSILAGNQADSHAYMHAMRSKKDSVIMALARWDSYLEGLVVFAKTLSDEAREEYKKGNTGVAPRYTETVWYVLKQPE